VKNFVVVALLGFMISINGNVFAQSCCNFLKPPKKEDQTAKTNETTPKVTEVIAGAEKELDVSPREEATIPQT